MASMSAKIPDMQKKSIKTAENNIIHYDML